MSDSVTRTERSFATIQAPVYVGRPWIRTTYQLASVVPASLETIDDKFQEAKKTVIYWLKDRVSAGLPQSAWDGESFRIELPGQKVEAIAIPDLGTWSFRFEHPDTPYGDRPAVPGRTWTTDIALTKRDSNVLVGVRAFCASLPYADAEVALTRPRVVVELAQRHGLMDQRMLSRDAWAVESETDLHEFYEFLTCRQRQLPVVVLTQPDKRRLDVEVSSFVLDPRELANRLLGVAHVVKLPWEFSYKWTDMVGKPWSTYLGAVRTYMPGLDFENDSPAQHPATFADKIIFWKREGDNRVGEGPFTDFLVERLFQHAAVKRINWENLLFLPEARTKHAEIARSKATEGENWQDLYEEQITALQEKVVELEREAEEYNDDALRSAQERDVYKEDNKQLRYQVDMLRQALSDRTDGKSESEIPIPDNYGDMPEWVSQHLAGRVVLHSRSLRGLRDADYEDVELVYRAMMLLANEYRNQCLGRPGAQVAFDQRIGELGLRLDRSISRERAGEQGDEYFVKFPTASSHKKLLEWHLRKSTNRETRYALAIYFFWDEDTQQVVVGWLPSHLDNRLT